MPASRWFHPARSVLSGSSPVYTLIGQSRRARFTRVDLVSGRAIRAAGGRILIDDP